VAEYGEAFPIAPNKTPQGKDNPAGRVHNRRIELVIYLATAAVVSSVSSGYGSLKRGRRAWTPSLLALHVQCVIP